MITLNSINLQVLLILQSYTQDFNVLRAFDLDLRRKTQVYLVKLSTTTMIYLLSQRNSVLVGPMRSKCSSSKGLDVAYVWVLGCFAFVCFPNWHNPHTTFLTLLSFGIPNTDSCSDTIDRCLQLACPILWCHRFSFGKRILLHTMSTSSTNP